MKETPAGNWQIDRILINLKNENGPRASSAPALGLNTLIFKHVYWYMQQISGERLQDHFFFNGFFSFLQMKKNSVRILHGRVFVIRTQLLFIGPEKEFLPRTLILV